MESNNEIYHYGILGMKWGIRRYQNKDGTLTPAGKRRMAKLENEQKLLKRETKSPSSSSSSGTKSVESPAKSYKPAESMTTQELIDFNNRQRQIQEYNKTTNPNRTKQLQDEYIELDYMKKVRDLKRELYPEEKTMAKKFIDEFQDKAVSNLASVFADKGKDVVNKMLSDMMKKK